MINVVIAIIPKNNKLLMIKRAKQEENLVWSFPSGKVNETESLEDACIREVYEETNIKVTIIKKIAEQHHPTKDIYLTYFLCKYISGKEKVLNKKEILKTSFKTKKEIYSLTKELFHPIKIYIETNIK